MKLNSRHLNKARSARRSRDRELRRRTITRVEPVINGRPLVFHIVSRDETITTDTTKVNGGRKYINVYMVYFEGRRGLLVKANEIRHATMLLAEHEAYAIADTMRAVEVFHVNDIMPAMIEKIRNMRDERQEIWQAIKERNRVKIEKLFDDKYQKLRPDFRDYLKSLLTTWSNKK